MQHETPGGIVVDFESTGYSACPAQAVVAAKGNRTQVKASGQLRSLGQILGNDFLECTIGVKGLFYDAKNASFVVEPEFPHVITTFIQRLTENGRL